MTVVLVALPAATAVSPPGEDDTVKPVNASPPVEAGGTQLTIAEAGPGAAVTAVGAPGGPIGVTPLEGGDAGPVPESLIADTLNE